LLIVPRRTGGLAGELLADLVADVVLRQHGEVHLDAGCLVKLSAVSFWMSTICGLLTINTLIDFDPLLPPPPAPLQPDRARPRPTGGHRDREKNADLLVEAQQTSNWGLV